jgi:hypothetical protein
LPVDGIREPAGFAEPPRNEATASDPPLPFFGDDLDPTKISVEATSKKEQETRERNLRVIASSSDLEVNVSLKYEKALLKAR